MIGFYGLTKKKIIHENDIYLILLYHIPFTKLHFYISQEKYMGVLII